MSRLDDISDPLKRSLADGLARLAAVSRQLDWQSAEAEGLSPTQADILRFVSRRPPPMLVFAAPPPATRFRPSNAKAISASIADAGDGRAVILKTTRQGNALVQHWPANFEPIVEGLDAAEQEVGDARRR